MFEKKSDKKGQLARPKRELDPFGLERFCVSSRARFAEPTFSVGKRFNISMSSSAQVWVETVIYTLIALALIGLILAFAKPKIDSIKDQLTIEQTIESMNKINDQLYEVQIAPGNKRILSVSVKKGMLIIDPETNSLNWVLESKYKYSEIGRPVRLGSLSILTTEGKPYAVSVSSNYSVDLTLNNGTSSFSFDASPTPYTLVIYNEGNVGGILHINLGMS